MDDHGIEADLLEAEIERILAMTDEEAMADHLARFDGNKLLAERAIDLMQVRLQKLLSKHWKH